MTGREVSGAEYIFNSGETMKKQFMQDDDVERYLKVLNSILAVGFILMLGNYFGLSPGITGNFFAEEENLSCEFNRNGEESDIPMDRCCYHASQQIKISETNGNSYYGSERINYSLNEDAVNYCSEEGFEIE